MVVTKVCAVRTGLFVSLLALSLTGLLAIAPIEIYSKSFCDLQ